jgi:hypothetical protein
MLLTILLTRVLGLALILLGVIFIVRRDYYIPVYATIVTERMTRLVFATAAVIAGLFLVVSHNIWLTLPSAIISLIGWMVLFEGLAYLILPDDVLKRLIAAVNRPIAYIAGGALAIFVGFYLTAVGFGLFTRF